MIEKDILLMWKGLSRPGIRNCSRRGKNAEDQARCNCLNGLYLLDRSMTGIRRPCFIPLFDLLKLGLQDLGAIFTTNQFNNLLKIHQVSS